MEKAVIFCVDDEKVVLNSLKAQLKNRFKNNFIIETAENAEEAIEIFNEYRIKEIDIPVVIADHIMPGMKGDEFLNKIHQISNRTYKIMLTGQADAEAVGNAVNHANLYRYISKPWDPTDLNLTIDGAIKSYFKDRTIFEQNRELEKLVNKLKIYNEQLEEKVDERTAEVVKQKNEIEDKNEELLQQNEEITSQRDQLDKQHQAITDSIVYAKRIQTAVLPPGAYIDEILPENFILFRPRDVVSGDFYWIRQINNYIILAAADCTGHGVPGAIMSMLGISFLNDIVRKREITDANQILNELRKEVKRSLRQSGKNVETRDGMDIALCVIETKTSKLQFSGAYNPLYLFRNGKFIEVKADRMPIGIHLKEKSSFTNHEIKLQTGDIFYIFSDGFSDQLGGIDDKKYLAKNFKQLLFDVHQKPMDVQKELLEHELKTWMKGYEQTDDVLVMGVRVS